MTTLAPWTEHRLDFEPRLTAEYLPNSRGQGYSPGLSDFRVLSLHLNEPPTKIHPVQRS